MKPRKWNLGAIIEEASQYDTMKDFRTKSESAYKAYVKQGKPQEVFSLFPDTRSYWTPESAVKEALKYENRWDFQKGSGGAYRFLWKAGLLDSVFDSLPEQPSWDYSTVKKAASGYYYRSDFKREYPGAYKWAYQNSKLDDIFGSTLKSPNSDRDILYIWKVHNLPNVFKIGVTSKRLGNKRVEYVCRKGDLCAEKLWTFETTKAGEIEASLLRAFKPYDFPDHFSGSKEFRVIPDIKGLLSHLEEYTKYEQE